MITKMAIAEFRSWLEDHGVEIKSPTNPYEVLRYKHAKFGTIVIYQNAKGQFTVNSVARKHYRCFKDGKRLGLGTGRPNPKRRVSLLRRLLNRDGVCCCVCGEPLGDDITIEHWHSLSSGGTNAIDNLGLAHQACNEALDDLSVCEKVEIVGLVRACIRRLEPGEVFDIRQFTKKGTIDEGTHLRSSMEHSAQVRAD